MSKIKAIKDLILELQGLEDIIGKNQARRLENIEETLKLHDDLAVFDNGKIEILYNNDGLNLKTTYSNQVIDYKWKIQMDTIFNLVREYQRLL